MDRGTGDSGVGERGPVPAQIGAPVEMAEHALNLGEDLRVVRIGTQETQDFVQPKDGAGTA